MAKRVSFFRLALGAYALLLLASHLARLLRPWRPGDPEGMTVVTVPAAEGVEELERPIRLALLDTGSRSDSLAPVVLLHGSPGTHREVGRLAELLGASRRALAPDLPGFGRSSHDVPDYSILAHARNTLSALDSLGIGRVHLLGFSMGGGVAISMAELAPERIASITLLSAIGVQEYELLGDYLLNHAVHGLQLVGLWLLREGVPHFGAWDGAFFGVEYARNFYDTDQRPLRGVLTRYQRPMLIIQGAHDDLVNPAVAIEHHRIVPQSELLMVDDESANHFMAFMRPQALAPVVAEFLDRVDRGEAVTRATADPARLADAAKRFDPATLPKPVGLTLGIMLLLIAAATFVSEDLACIATGLLVARGTLGFVEGTLACFAGIVIGDLGLFAAGRWLGRGAVRRAPLRWLISETDVTRTSAWFARHGAWIAIATRFVPGTRLPTYFTAGVLQTSAVAFLLAFVVAAAAWTPLLVGASAVFGSRVIAAFTQYQRFAIPTIFGIAVLLYLLVKLVIPLATWRGRRRVKGRWLRLTRWEYWPRTAVYGLLLPYLLWLAFKHRSLTVWTAANPGIPGGGFVGESKAEILAGFGPSARIARWVALPPGSVESRLALADRFMDADGLAFPMVVKPDVGERGSGVAFPASRTELARYLEAATETAILQELVPGEELGIFYVKRPSEPRGRIFAITRKEFPELVGDGRRSIEELILAHPRAVAMARVHLARWAERLDEVPGDGEQIPLVQVGTHSRGSTFFDGTSLATDAMLEALDQLGREPGFCFGRYDVRGPSLEAIQAGRFKVIEANGTGAEATSIYDPGNSLGTGLAVLRRQWALAFEIGRANVAAGARQSSARELLGLLAAHRRAVRAHVTV
ncbi:MAG: alpha/beta fold hydrolase [Gemmatimonadales bacterium]